jgi:hypothetical protein
MRKVSSSEALEFVRAVELPPTEAPALEAIATFDFDKARNQALVVGSDIISFVQGVSESRRGDIVNSALLAQLVAKKRVPDGSRIFEWYDSYFDTLSNIGWVIQDRQFVKHTESSRDFEAHEAVLTVAASLLGPGTAALQIVKSTLDALSSMKQNSPFFTLFNRETQSAETARFQITLADQAEGGQFLVNLMAFGLAAKSTLMQVLFFKFHGSGIELKHASGRVTINTTVLESVRDAVAKKLAAHSSSYVLALPDL